jgi:predicted transcriptional regulator of viral defense system
MPEGGRENELCGRFLDQALSELAREQHGVFGLAQLRELGLTARAVQKRVATGRLHRIYRGVYALVPRELLSRDGLYMAAVLACGAGAVHTHRSAARLHELRDYGYTRFEVTVPRRSPLRHPGVAVHRSLTLTAADATVVDNIPVTTVARTLFDLAEVLTQRQLERAFDQAEILETLDLKAINDQLARNPTRRGAKAVRRVLDTHYIGKTPTWNENEELLLSITRSLGLPDPDTNQLIVLPDGGPPLRVDFVWREQRIIIEADSGKWHNTRQRFEIDRRRDQRLTAAGWIVIRTTWRQMKYRPHELRETLLKLLGPASPSGRASPAAAADPAPAPARKRRAGESTSSRSASGPSRGSTRSSARRRARRARSS